MPRPRTPTHVFLVGDVGRGLLAISALVLVTLGYNDRAAVDPRPVDAIWVGLLVLAGVPVVFARARPLAAAVVTLGVSVGGLVAGWPMEAPLVLALVLIGHAVGRAPAGRVAVFAAWSGCAIAVVAFVRADHDRLLATVGGFAVGTIPALIAEQIRAVRADAREAHLRARQIEELRDRDVQRAVLDERLRIARDLHDITGHHLSAIALQAGGAARSTREPLARHSLEQIHELASSALNQTRRAVGLLREDDDEAASAPLPRLDSIEHLLTTARTAGIAANLLTEGPVRELPDLTEVCAYRVVQESLTNVVRHAEAHAVTISMQYGEDALTITIQDDGRGRAPRPGRSAGPVRVGARLPGMHQRLDLVGGTLAAGPGPGGWVVCARLPIGEPAIGGPA